MDNAALYRQMLSWRITNNLVDEMTLQDIRNFLLVRFRSMRRVEIDCDTDQLQMTLFIKLKPLYRLFIRKNKFSSFIIFLVKQYVTDYDIKVRYV